MAVHIALLRAINVAGHQPVGMAALRDVFLRLGCADVRTMLQSGNVVFGGGQGRGAALERWLEDAIAAQLAVRPDVVVRTAKEWAALVDANPLRADAERDPARFALVCLKTSPMPGALDALQAAISGPERVAAVGRELYVVYPEGMGRSRLTMAVMERKLATKGTARNWNTVRKLAAMTA